MIKGFWIVPGWITHMYILDKPSLVIQNFVN